MLLYSRCIHLRRALHCKLLPTLIVSIILCASTSKYAMRTKPLGCSEEAKGRSPCKRLLYTNYIIITTLLLLFSWYWWGCWGHDADCNKTLELAEGKLSASHYLMCSVKPAEWMRRRPSSPPLVWRTNKPSKDDCGGAGGRGWVQ